MCRNATINTPAKSQTNRNQVLRSLSWDGCPKCDADFSVKQLQSLRYTLAEIKSKWEVHFTCPHCGAEIALDYNNEPPFDTYGEL